MFHRAVMLITVVVVALAGCKAEDVRPEDRTVITFAYPGYLTAFNKANYELLAKAFNAENADLWVELREVSSEDLEQGAYLELVFNEEWGVDVLLSRSFGLLLGHEHVLSLGSLVAPHPEFDLDDFYPLALDMLSQGGDLWGLPAELDLVVIYYNKDLFDQAGVPYPTNDWTRDDFLETAVALRQGLPEREITFAGRVNETMPFIYGHGGAVTEGRDITLTAPRTVEAVRWFTDLALVYDVMPLPARLEAYEPEARAGRSIVIGTSGDGEVAEAQLRWGMIGAKADVAAQDGDVALWSGALVDREGTGGWHWNFEWGILPWPRDRVDIVASQAYAYYVSADTPHPQAALRWVDFLTRQPPQLKGIPARRSVAASEPVRRSFVEQIGAEAYDACLRMIEQATPMDHGLYVVADFYLGQALLDILENDKDVETALAEAQAALEALR